MEEDSDTPPGPHTCVKLCHQVCAFTLWLILEDPLKDHSEFLSLS